MTREIELIKEAIKRIDNDIEDYLIIGFEDVVKNLQKAKKEALKCIATLENAHQNIQKARTNK